MKFLKLEILNLASLDRQGGETINFEEGALGESTIFSIVGPTGSGKSTILDAICLALYNRAPRYAKNGKKNAQKISIFGEAEDGEKNRLAPSDPRNILTHGKKQGYSKLTFLANNGNVYRAEWFTEFKNKNYDNTQTHFYLITVKDGKQEEQEANWEDLPQIIGLDYEQFLRTVLIAQGSFANFLISSEENRYELLEKLIGCGEMYSSITAKIKQQRDDAVKAYDQIAASLSAHEKDIIPEEELAVLKERICQLEEIEKNAKAELAKVTEALAWYSTNDRLCDNIAKYEETFNEAKTMLESIKDQTNRLQLHDATLKATSIFKEIKTSEEKIAKYSSIIKMLDEDIAKKEQEIKTEVEENLAKLKDEALKIVNEIELQKPHINKAREIKAELDALKKALNEKTIAKDDADKAKDKADKDVALNNENIDKATQALLDARKKLEDLLREIENRNLHLKESVDEASVKYNTENAKLEGCDAANLQEDKTLAEKKQSNLKAAIHIQEELNKKCSLKEQNITLQKEKETRNNEIASLLKTFDVESLSKELDTLMESYTLMTSEKWEEHRKTLKDDEPCPLCGSTHHPYHNEETVAPVIDKMKDLIDCKRDNLSKQREAQQELLKEQGQISGILSGIKVTLINLDKDISTLSANWDEIHRLYKDWPEDAHLLRELQMDIDKNAFAAALKLSEYNDLVKKVEELRKAKESADTAMREFEKTSVTKKQDAEKAVVDANTALETEKGKTENLKTQQKEKTEAQKSSAEALAKVEDETKAKTKALNDEIGDKDPEAFEKDLYNAKNVADKAVSEKTELVARLREELKEIRGNESANKTHMENERTIIINKEEELSRWLADYNSSQSEDLHLTKETIAQLYYATDNWEVIRANQKRALEAFTSAETTYNNEQKAYKDHQDKKPEQQKDVLLERKVELENISSAELVDSKARLQRHETAKLQMGTIFQEKQQAELLKNEWEEISSAIGSDGKTLRKIAQCYTLRFLIEHANAEIRKFNSRYELLQVKNSLGIRVIDHDRADDVRDTTSLSGGETFIVSLGLALGLSALSSRNISFENLFIDEGFGTLDPDTLATVIDSLAMLQSSQGKKVGVISHTDTMSERITTQIRIIKNGNSGSSHIEVYP